MHTWRLPVRVGYGSRTSCRLENRISSEHFFEHLPFCAGNYTPFTIVRAHILSDLKSRMAHTDNPFWVDPSDPAN